MSGADSREGRRHECEQNFLSKDVSINSSLFCFVMHIGLRTCSLVLDAPASKDSAVEPHEVDLSDTAALAWVA